MESTILRPSNPECFVWLVIYVKSLSGFIHPPHMCVRGIKLLFLAIDIQRSQECPVPINYLIETGSEITNYQLQSYATEV